MKNPGNMNLDYVPFLMQAHFEKPGVLQLNLRHAIFGNFGILRTLSWFSRETEKKHPGTSIEYSSAIQEREIPDRLKNVLFRVVQESVANAVRHGKSERIRIALRKVNRWLQLVVEDNGRGFRSPDTGGVPPTGLDQMQKGVDSTGGIFSISSAPGKGTTVKSEWKIK